MNLSEQLLAGLTLAVCAVLLVRLCLGPARRQGFDRILRGWGWTLRHGALQLWHWRAARRLARSEAEAAIRRARAGNAETQGEWTGNVYTPKSFRKPRRPDQLH